ncbi:MAG: DUF2802 domain-containing protein [Thermodesulfobacteriota bacterium]
MPSFTIEFWLIFQMVIEVVLCGGIIYYFYREKNRKNEVKLAEEKLKTLLGSLHRLVAESEDLDRKHQRVLKLWEKIERKGGVIEEYVDRYQRELRSFSKDHLPGEEDEKMEPGFTCYEKASSLVERGYSVGEIAQKVGLPQGEVELIMNLKRQ